MQVYKSIRQLLQPSYFAAMSIQTAGVKSYGLPPDKKEFEYPEYRKLKIVKKVPQYPAHLRPFKMQKRLRLMRGPELFHNTLIHKQFGIIATSGGRMKFNNYEMIRMMLLRNVDYDKVFAVWRIPDPWQPLTKKGQGTRLGGGKPSIDQYVTPVKVGQVIFEVGGPVEFIEVSYALKNIAKRLPFDAMVVTQEKMEEMAIEKKKFEEENLNPWTWKYIIQNNMLGCHIWISKYDKRWFNEYV